MSSIDIESLLSEISGESPCGEDLEYDPSFQALESMLRPKDPGGIVEGVDEAVEEPNWREVREKTLELLGRSKDLRLAMYLTLALLKMEGILGFRDGVAFVRGLLERYWEGVYPRLDPDDNNDPLQRINIVQAFSPVSVSAQDPMKFRQRLSEVPLCRSVQMGSFSYRDIQVARGEISAGDEEGAQGPEMSVIDAAFQDTATEELEATAKATEEALEHLAGITTAFSTSAAQGQSPDVGGSQAILGSIHKCVDEYLAKRGLGGAAGEPGEAGGEGAKGGISLAGEISSPKEALLALEKVCQYFDRHEPSSPVPLLLRRAQRLVSKNFVEVITDICPDALSRVQLIGGSSGESESA
ncbi:MAG: type VI secretion system protein TssA [Phycisphaerales bacterium]|nr:MAG: type VI secretion system protein TssA [Phycisphaerales bacterium]